MSKKNFALMRSALVSIFVLAFLVTGRATEGEQVQAPTATSSWWSPSPCDTPAQMRPEARCDEVPGKKIRSWAIENDAWGHWFHPTDRDYTMGVPISESIEGEPSGSVWKGFFYATHFINSLVDDRKPAQWEADHDRSFWMWGNSTFTPQNLRTSEPLFNDRPYASILYAGGGYTHRYAFPTMPLFNDVTTSLQIGVLGTGVSESVQMGIHKVCCPDDLPQGWDNQIGAGGSLTFLYGQTLSTAQVTNDQDPQLAIGHLGPLPIASSVELGYDVGYRVDVRAGLTFAVGMTINDLIFAMGSTSPLAAASPQYGNIVPVNAPAPPKRQFSAPAIGGALYVHVGVQAIAYNELLEGAWTGKNNVTIPRNRYEHVVEDATLGIDLAWISTLACNAWTLVAYQQSCREHSSNWAPRTHYYLVQSWRSRDLKDGTEGSHYWGALRFTYEID
jgi:hypothetical protein